MTTTPFSDIASFVRAPRLTGLAASRSGMTVVTRRSIDDDGAAFVDQLFEVTPNGARQLTHGDKSASLLAVGERGEVYFSRTDPGAKDKGDALWMLPPQGEAREIFRYRGGIEDVRVTATNLLLTLSVLPNAGKEADSGPKESASSQPSDSVSAELAASADLTKKREDGKVSAVLHDIYPIRYWNADLGPGVNRLFVAPLPPLVQEPDLAVYQAKSGSAESAVDDVDFPNETPTNELTLTAVVLPPRPEGAHQWDLSYAIPTPDGMRALVAMESRHTIDSFHQVWVVDLTGADQPRRVAAEPEVNYDVEAVSTDGTWAILSRDIPPLPGQTVDVDLLKLDLADGTLTQISQHSWGQVTLSPGGALYRAADRHGRGGVFHLADDGAFTLITPDDEYAYSDLVWAGDRLAALRSSIAEAPVVVYIDPDTGEVSAGPALAGDLELPGELTEISATAQDGTPLRAWLALPDGDGPYPLVVFAHGGPWGSWNDWTWRWNPWVFAARGYAVLLPDPGISTGYGQEMLSRGHDSIGDLPFTDIMTLTDAAIARPDIDETRQAFAGGSYGGYMANWVAGHTGTRFRCIISHAALWNIGIMSSTTDNGSWYRWMMGSSDSVAQGASQTELWSPHDSAHEIQVPMLVIHGDKDFRVPFSQGLELWSDLQRLSPELGHKFLYFPDEGHWILKPGNAQVWYETFLAFLDQHVLGKDFARPQLLG